VGQSALVSGLGHPRRACARLTVVTVALAALALIGAPAAQGDTTVYRGAFKCASDGKPLAGARIELWQTHVRWLPEVPPNFEHRNTTRADDNGAWGFTVGGDETNWRIRLVLVGPYARVQDWPFPWNWFTHTLRSQNDVPVRDYGMQVVQGYQCGLYTGFDEAARDYVKDVGSPPPQGLSVVRAGAPTAGVPFTLYDETWWPSGYAAIRNGFSVAKHEFAHMFRHTLDGSPAHFTFDSTYFWYLRSHSASSCEPTNSGFAFNEGWAEYWQGQNFGRCDGNRDTGTIERNVATMLKELEDSCGLRPVLRRGAMVQVLRDNRGRIHSIDEFAKALNCPKPIKLGKVRKPAAVVLSSERQKLLGEGRKIVVRLGRTVTRLNRSLRVAKLRAKAPVPCPARPCEARIERGVRPVLLAGELEQTKLLKKKLAFLGSSKGIRRLVRLPVPRQLRRIESVRKATVSALARSSVKTLGRVRGVAKRLGADAESLRIISRARVLAGRRDPGTLAAMAPVQIPIPQRSGPTPGAPTPVPTPGPTPVPTPEPMPVPTPGPTPDLPAGVFADWTGVAANVATGTLPGRSISLSGSNVVSPPGSVVDGTSTVFDAPYFTPRLTTSDVIYFAGFPGYSYTLAFGAPTKDPVLHLASLASTLAFPAGTQIEKVNGEDTLTVSGSSVVGVLAGSHDANGTVRLKGTFESIPFSATPVYSPASTEDGIFLQAGG
jgi:hypothetical protein